MGVRVLRRLAVVMMVVSLFAVGVGPASGQSTNPTTLTVSPVSPTPTPAGTTGAVTITLHIGNDVTFDGSALLYLSGEFPGWSDPYPVNMSAMTGNGYPGEDCALNSTPPPWPGTGCEFLASVGDDFVFTLWPAVGVDAPVGSTYGIEVFLHYTGLPLSPTGSTVLEVGAALVDPTTLTVSAVDPTPTPAGTTGAVTVNIHIGNDMGLSGSETRQLTLEGYMADWSEPHYVSMLPVTGNGYPGEDCGLNSSPAPWPSRSCWFDAVMGGDYEFTITPIVTDDAPVGSMHQINVTLHGTTGIPTPNGSTVLEASAAPTVTTSSTTTTAAETTTTAAETTTTAAETTTTAAETTTTAAETTTTSGSEVLGDTLISSTTIAATTTDDTLPATGSSDDLNRTALMGFALVLLGIVTLAGATVIGQHRRQ